MDQFLPWLQYFSALLSLFMKDVFTFLDFVLNSSFVQNFPSNFTVGIISGAYSGFIIYKWTTYKQLHNDLIPFLHALGRSAFISDAGQLQVYIFECFSKLLFIQAQLYLNGHFKAAVSLKQMLDILAQRTYPIYLLKSEPT